MSEKRKPVFVFLLKKSGKTKRNKVEVFDAVEFADDQDIIKSRQKGSGRKLESSYRLRVNGKWYPKGKKLYYWRSEIKDLIFKSINF